MKRCKREGNSKSEYGLIFYSESNLHIQICFLMRDKFILSLTIEVKLFDNLNMDLYSKSRIQIQIRFNVRLKSILRLNFEVKLFLTTISFANPQKLFRYKKLCRCDRFATKSFSTIIIFYPFRFSVGVGTATSSNTDLGKRIIRLK